MQLERLKQAMDLKLLLDDVAVTQDTCAAHNEGLTAKIVLISSNGKALQHFEIPIADYLNQVEVIGARAMKELRELGVEV